MAEWFAIYVCIGLLWWLITLLPGIDYREIHDVPQWKIALCLAFFWPLVLIGIVLWLVRKD